MLDELLSITRGMTMQLQSMELRLEQAGALKRGLFTTYAPTVSVSGQPFNVLEGQGEGNIVLMGGELNKPRGLTKSKEAVDRPAERKPDKEGKK
jgi:hypothetical protein